MRNKQDQVEITRTKHTQLIQKIQDAAAYFYSYLDSS